MYDPSPTSYAGVSIVGAITPILASSPVLADIVGTADAVVTVAPWWGPLLFATIGAGAASVLLWCAKTVLSAIFKGAAAGLRAVVAIRRRNALKTTTLKDDDAVAVTGDVLEAVAQAFEESGKNIPAHKD